MWQKIIIIGILIAGILFANAFARTIEVPVLQAAVISPGEHEQNLSLGPRVCLKFDLPSEVQGVEIGFAQLVVHLSLPVITDDSLAVFQVFGLRSDWGENAGWNDFLMPGGDVDSAFYSDFTFRCGADTVVSLDVTDWAREWNNSRSANHGLIVIPRKMDLDSFRQFEYLPGQLRNLVTLRILVPGRQE